MSGIQVHLILHLDFVCVRFILIAWYDPGIRNRLAISEYNKNLFII